MTVVNPKSISGINSITMASGSDNLLTIHSNNTTERVRVDSSGNLTATSFSGNGSSLTGVASTENIRTNTNATFLQNVNVSGTSTIGGDVNIADKIVHTGDTNTAIRFPEADTLTVETNGAERIRIQSNGNTGIGTITAQNNARLQVSTNQQVVAAFEGTGVSDPQIYLGDDMTTPTDNCIILGYDKADNRGYLTVGGDGDNVFTVKNGGDIEIGVGNLAFASGKGIDFSATSDAGGMTSELLDDYEEGTWTPTFSSSGATFVYNHQYGYYQKVGDHVHVTFYITLSGTNSSGLSGNAITINLPFSASGSSTRFEAGVSYGMIYKIDLVGYGNPMGTVYQGNSYISVLGARDDNTGVAYSSDQFDASGCGISGSVTYKV